jgi:predicted nucleotidyltransferase
MADRSEAPRLLAVLRSVADTFGELGVPWALIGGLAVSVRAEPRFTRDIDLAVAVPDDTAAEQLIHRLTAFGFHVMLSLEQDVLGRLATVRLVPPGENEEGIVVDLLFASSGIEPEICRDAERLEVAPGLYVPVAQAGHLIALKILAEAPDRQQDVLDLQALTRDLSLVERQRALDALRQITAIGANRGKPLEAHPFALHLTRGR